MENISKIEKSIKGMSKAEFEKNVDVVDAVIRRIEIIGEAVKNLSSELKNNNKNIEWKKIAGTRDVLIHAYFDVDIDLLWVILEKDLAKLKEDVERIIKSIDY